MILFCSAEFGYFELSDAFATGSSLMPQKKNPDVFELARGKSGALLGYLTGLLATLKGLPSAYDKDLQEDKLPVFNASDTLSALLPVLANALHSMSIHPERMQARIGADLMATDLADYLVDQGMPFRQAHILVGNAIQLAGSQGQSLERLSIADYQSISPEFGADVLEVFDAERSIRRRAAYGGTAPIAVVEQLRIAREVLTPEG